MIVQDKLLEGHDHPHPLPLAGLEAAALQDKGQVLLLAKQLRLRAACP